MPGAHDCIDLEDQLEGSLERLLKRMQAEHASRNDRGPLDCRGFGLRWLCCSTIAANVAAAVAEDHGRCGLLDLNLCGGDLAVLLGLKARRSLTDLCGRRNWTRPCSNNR